jgi:hypothetical protein
MQELRAVGLGTPAAKVEFKTAEEIAALKALRHPKPLVRRTGVNTSARTVTSAAR